MPMGTACRLVRQLRQCHTYAHQLHTHDISAVAEAVRHVDRKGTHDLRFLYCLFGLDIAYVLVSQKKLMELQLCEELCDILRRVLRALGEADKQKLHARFAKRLDWLMTSTEPWLEMAEAGADESDVAAEKDCLSRMLRIHDARALQHFWIGLSAGLKDGLRKRWPPISRLATDTKTKMVHLVEVAPPDCDYSYSDYND